jgi:hypothetical protein
MKRFDHKFLEDMKGKLDVELIGVASVETSNSRELNERASALLPGAKSVVVLGKETFKEVVAHLKGQARPSPEIFSVLIQNISTAA